LEDNFEDTSSPQHQLRGNNIQYSKQRGGKQQKRGGNGNNGRNQHQNYQYNQNQETLIVKPQSIKFSNYQNTFD